MTCNSAAMRQPPRKTNRAGPSALAYQTRPALVSIRPATTRLPTQGQGQDFRHHARSLREGSDSGYAGQAGTEVQAQQDAAAVVVVAVAGVVPVAVGRAAPPRIVVPGAATQHAGEEPCPLTLGIGRSRP